MAAIIGRITVSLSVIIVVRKPDPPGVLRHSVSCRKLKPGGKTFVQSGVQTLVALVRAAREYVNGASRAVVFGIERHGLSRRTKRDDRVANKRHNSRRRIHSRNLRTIEAVAVDQKLTTLKSAQMDVAPHYILNRQNQVRSQLALDAGIHVDGVSSRVIGILNLIALLDDLDAAHRRVAAVPEFRCELRTDPRQ